jgi:hypothetical protein
MWSSIVNIKNGSAPGERTQLRHMAILADPQWRNRLVTLWIANAQAGTLYVEGCPPARLLLCISRAGLRDERVLVSCAQLSDSAASLKRGILPPSDTQRDRLFKHHRSNRLAQTRYHLEAVSTNKSSLLGNKFGLDHVRRNVR